MSSSTAFQEFTDLLVGVADRRGVEPADDLALAFGELLGAMLGARDELGGCRIGFGHADGLAVALRRRVWRVGFEQMRPDERLVARLFERLARHLDLGRVATTEHPQRFLDCAIERLRRPIDGAIEREVVEQELPAALQSGEAELADVAVDVVAPSVAVLLAEPRVRVDARGAPARILQRLAHQRSLVAQLLVATVIERQCRGEHGREGVGRRRTVTHGL